MSEKNEIHLRETLTILFDKIYGLIIEYKNSGEIIKIPCQHIPIKTLDFSSNFYSHDYDNIRYYDFYDWDSPQFVACFREIKSLQEYKNATEEIIVFFGLDEKAEDFGLSDFTRILMKKVPNDTITKDNLTTWLDFFIDSFRVSIQKDDIIWHVDVWLQNIHIESDEIEILAGVKLRHPRPENFDIFEQRKSHIDEADRHFGKSLSSTAILSFDYKGKPYSGVEYPIEIHSEINCFLNILRLYSPSSIKVQYQSFLPDNIFGHEWTDSGDKNNDLYYKGKVPYEDRANYSVKLKDSEREKLKAFATKMFPILKNHSSDAYFIGTAYELALHRYNDALVNSETKPYQIVSCMSAMEALLSENPAEIIYKIRFRAAALLRRFEFEPIEVYEKINKAYSLRSKLVHGSDDKKELAKLLEFARTYSYEIINYTRVCLIAALQLKEKLEKKDLIAILNYSLIDNKKSEELDLLITENVIAP